MSDTSRLVLILACLNLFDAFATLHLSAGYEGNPLVAPLLGNSLLFLTAKVCSVWCLATVLGVFEAHRCLLALIGVYGVVCALHVWTWTL